MAKWIQFSARIPQEEYAELAPKFKSSQELLYWFVDIISKGGNYLLNIGPDAKEEVPSQCVANMLEMGQWVQTNVDAIYGTTSWEIFNEGKGNTALKGT